MMNSSVLQIHNRNYSITGTGFVIENNNDGVFVATCGHVIKNFLDDIYVSSKKADIIIDQYADGIDLAVLYVKGLDEKAFDLGNDNNPGKVKIIGFSKFGKDSKREPIYSVDIKYNIDVPKKSLKMIRLYPVSGTFPNEKISSGYSGSPVICELTNKVVGIVTLEVQDNSNYGICISNLLKIYTPNKNKNIAFLNGKIKISKELTILEYQMILRQFEKNLELSLQSFSSQPILWVDPVIHNFAENSSKKENISSRIKTSTLISEPKSRIINSNQQFGLTSLAHYLVKSAWESGSFWFYIDLKLLKSHRNEIARSIKKSLNDLSLSIEDIECVVLDGYSNSLNQIDKIYEAILEMFPGKALLVMFTHAATMLSNNGNYNIKESRKFESLFLWALPRDCVRKIVSDYNIEKYIGDEDEVVSKVVSDLEVLNIPRTPLNCLTILKISEFDFDDNPVNRAEMIKKVLFLLFNIDDMPKYKTRPDLKDTEFVLGFFCEKMLKENSYVFSRNDFIDNLKSTCKNLEIDLEVSVIFDVLYNNNIITEFNEAYCFRFNYWIFYFAAQRMQQNDSFKQYLFEDMRYAQYPEIMEFYTGTDRSREDALELLTKNLNETRKIVDKKCGLPEGFNIYDIAKWTPTDSQIEKMHSDAKDGVLKSNLPDVVKDQYADTSYDRVKPLNQRIGSIMEEYSLLRLMKGVEAAAKALRNSDFTNPELRHSLLSEILLSWEQILKMLVVLSPILADNGMASSGGASFILDDSFDNLSKEEKFSQVIKILPKNIVRWYKDYLYSDKMAPLLYKNINNSNYNTIIEHKVFLLLIFKRPKGWEKMIEKYLLSLDKNSFYLMNSLTALRSEYEFSFSSPTELSKLSNLIKISTIKHHKGINKTSKKSLKKLDRLTDFKLPERDPGLNSFID